MSFNQREPPRGMVGVALTGEASTTIFEEIRVEATHTDRVSSLSVCLSGVDLTPAETNLPTPQSTLSSLNTSWCRLSFPNNYPTNFIFILIIKMN